MLRVCSMSLYCAIALFSIAFVRVEAAIADRIVNSQVLPLSPAGEVIPILVGQRSASRYVVIIPTSSLEQARSYLTSIQPKVIPYGQIAFATSNFLGPYVYVISFNQRYKADDFLRLIPNESSARVVYFP